MFYYLYEITNTVNGKIYIGVHQTDNLDDGYMGSGTLLKRAIKRHGIESFSKKILKFFDTAEEMFAEERKIVNENFVKRKDTYNVNIGGDGGWFSANINHNNKGNWRRTGFVKLLDDGINPRKEWYDALSESEKSKYNEKISNGLKQRIKINGHWWEGKTHTAKTLQKMHETHLKNHHQSGSKNSQFGKHWWTNPKTGESHSFQSGQVPEGWIRGRKMRTHS